VADLGRTLRRLRKSMRMTIYDVERRTGLHYSTISKYERNERLPSLQVLKELAELYGVPLGSLVAEDGRAGVSSDLLLRATVLSHRPELVELFELAEELTPEQVNGLAAMLRLMNVGGWSRREPTSPTDDRNSAVVANGGSAGGGGGAGGRAGGGSGRAIAGGDPLNFGGNPPSARIQIHPAAADKPDDGQV